MVAWVLGRIDVHQASCFFKRLRPLLMWRTRNFSQRIGIVLPVCAELEPEWSHSLESFMSTSNGARIDAGIKPKLKSVTGSKKRPA